MPGSFLATPLPAYLRVPLRYYRALTLPYHDDETNSQIHRVYQPVGEEHAMRHFCGFCGTPLSYWSESPRSEADFIRLTLGSLLPEDLRDLEEWGLVPDPGSASGMGTPLERDEAEAAGNWSKTGESGTRRDAGTKTEGEWEVGKVGEESTWGRVGVLPWFEALMEGSRLGTTMRRARGGGTDPTGRVRIEWEVAEWSAEDENGDESPRKRKFDEVEDVVEPERVVGRACTIK